MSENGSVDNGAGNRLEITEEEVPEIRTWTQEGVNERIKGFIAPLKRKLEGLSRLVQVMVTTRHPCHYPRTDYSTISGAAIHQPNTDVCLFLHVQLLCRI